MLSENMTLMAAEIIKALILRMLEKKQTRISKEQIEVAITERLALVASSVDEVQRTQNDILANMQAILSKHPAVHFQNSSISIDGVVLQIGNNNNNGHNQIRDSLLRPLNSYFDNVPDVDTLPPEENRSKLFVDTALDAENKLNRSQSALRRWRESVRAEREAK